MKDNTDHPIAHHSQEIAQKSGSSFLYSFLFLPSRQQQAIRTIYAFARKLDDSVDEIADPARQKEKLAYWNDELNRCYHDTPQEGFMQELALTIRDFQIPREPFQQLIQGCEMDIVKKQYQTYDELREYCYCVASTIGLICLPVFGCQNPQSKEYALELGQALQLTNILRDVGSDARRGRIYLPQEDLQRFGYSSEELQRQIYNENFKKLMRFEAERAESLYQKAQSFLSHEDHRRLIAARIMAKTYHAILQKIIRQEYRIFDKKITLSKPHKLALAILTFLNLDRRGARPRT